MSKKTEALKCVGCSLAREVGEMCVWVCVCERVREQWKRETHRETETQRNLENTYGVVE